MNMKDMISMGLKSTKASGAGRICDRGFTLIELLVTLAVASIVMAAIYSVYAGLTKSYTTQNAAADAQQAVRATIDFMAEDIMMAGFDKKREAAAGFVDARVDYMEFTSDRNMDGKIEDTDEYERIIYDYDGSSTLEYQYNAADGRLPLMENVTEFSFTYLDADGNKLVDPVPVDDIRTVVIKMKVAEEAGREGTVDREYTTQVKCRNIGLSD